MRSRFTVAAVALLPLLLGTNVMAKGMDRDISDVSFLGFGGSGRSAPVTKVAGPQYAQAMDPRVDNLEDQLRRLNGKIEELNFQVLQMQDRINKMQNDNEFRFEQLENKQGGGNGGSARPAPDRRKEDRPAVKGQLEPPAGENSDEADAGIKDIIQAPDASGGRSQGGSVADAGGTGDGRGAPPRNLGSLTFDSSGNPVNGSVNEDAIESRPELERPGSREAEQSKRDNTQVASLPPTDSANELYRDSYQFILSGDYKTAEQGFREHIARYPKDPRAADAHFWLGEALLGQDKYREAAQTFLDANREYPKSRKAPDMLLKLGVSLAAMHQRDIACATYKEIGVKYPKASEALKARTKREESLSGC